MVSSRLGLTVLMLLAPPTMLLGLHERVPPGPGHDHQRLEVARLRTHFDSVDAECGSPRRNGSPPPSARPGPR